MTTATVGVEDVVVAQMVECAPEPQPETKVAVPAAPDCPSPTTASAQATIENTGADPPPVEENR